jgi:deoxyadenosine/deoxycytidine kinase
MKKPLHIAIAGNIGSGKTTLARMLSKHYKWEAHYEDVDNNPYLEHFYEDMRRWSFNLQIYFLTQRFEQIIAIRNGKKNVVQDRTIYEDAYIFAPNLHEMGLMRTQDFESYLALFNLINRFIQPPDLLIYLKASVPTLVRQIQARGRMYESSIRLDYLKSLSEKYDQWIEAYDVGNIVVVDVDHLDIPGKAEDLGLVIEKINAQIYGLFDA